MASDNVTKLDIDEALKRVRPVIGPTPLSHSPTLSEELDVDVYLKWDNKLRTGAFKERGAINFLAQLSAEEKARGVCAASAGNHAMALSYHASKASVPCVIVMPTTAPLVKVQYTEHTGAEVVLSGATFDEALTTAKQITKDRNLSFVSAFDDPKIIAGQGTCALEIFDQLSDIDAIAVPVGGGGYISGIAIAAKALNPKVFVLGAQSLWATEAQERRLLQPGVHQRLRAPSIADGIAVKKRGELTSKLMSQHVDKFIQLSEQEFAHGVIQFLEYEKALVEGAGAAGLAALYRRPLPKHCKRVVVVVSGGNIDINVLSRLIQGDMAARGRLVRLLVSVSDRPGSLYTVTGIIAQCGANVLEVHHDRSFSQGPGMVGIMFLIEVRDSAHKESIVSTLKSEGVPAYEF